MMGVRLVADAATRRVDVAFVVTRDTDLVAAIRVAKEENPALIVVAVLPPCQSKAMGLVDAADFTIKMTINDCERYLLPEVLTVRAYAAPRSTIRRYSPNPKLPT